MEKAIVVLSGGQDSTTCLYWALNKGYDVHTVTFDYGQRHIIELEAARKIAKMAGVPNEVIKLGPILKGTSTLVSENAPDQYNDVSEFPEGVLSSFVPMRNQLFLTIAANRAYVLGARRLVTGVCQADGPGYPDTRREFIRAFTRTCNLGTFTGEPGTLGGLYVDTPLMDLSKAETVRLALSLPGCYRALAYSHTSYDGTYPPTDNNHANVLRAKGFELAGVPDPLVLRAYKEGVMRLPDTDNYAQGVVRKYLPLLD